MRMRYLVIVGLLLAATQGVAAGFRAVAPAPPPPLVLGDVFGGRQGLEDHRGKVVLVNFWATWCPPCRREMPSMQRLKEKMKGRPFVILGVDSAEERDEVRAFLRLVRVDFPILLDVDAAATKSWKVFALPTSFLIDRAGNVRYSIAGPVEWDEGEAVELIEGLLREN